ncbi:MAG: signal recognition particle protein, partial [Ferrovum sp.]|nr:signal recognition particle protein [Ferrovum sp.]
MINHLTSRLSQVVKNLRGQSRLTEANIQETLREVRQALLEADVALPAVKHFIDQIKSQAVGHTVLDSLTPGQALIEVVHRALIELMGGPSTGLNLATQPPAILLMAGLQGSGKTTSSGKLAKWLNETQKKKVLLASCDIYRPAAMEQLKILAQSIDVDYFEVDPALGVLSIATQAKDYATKHFYDVLIMDTAGRLAVDEALMNELKQLSELLHPIETLFVVDAMQGQDALKTAHAFHEHIKLTGVIMTKMDGDARGGAALSVRHITQVPIKFLGVGEKITGLELFHPDRVASRILGMGDVLSLIEEAHKNVDHEAAQKLATKMSKGERFTLSDFKDQLLQMKKVGGVQSMMDKLPTQLTQGIPTNKNIDDKALKRIEGIIDSMTPKERNNPDILKASRKRRIAQGAGVPVSEVNKLLTQFEQMQKMMKMFSKGGG